MQAGGPNGKPDAPSSGRGAPFRPNPETAGAPTGARASGGPQVRSVTEQTGQPGRVGLPSPAGSADAGNDSRARADEAELRRIQEAQRMQMTEARATVAPTDAPAQETPENPAAGTDPPPAPLSALEALEQELYAVADSTPAAEISIPSMEEIRELVYRNNETEAFWKLREANRRWRLALRRRRRMEETITPMNLTEFLMNGQVTAQVVVLSAGRKDFWVEYRTTRDGDAEAARKIHASYPESDRDWIWNRLLLCLHIQDAKNVGGSTQPWPASDQRTNTTPMSITTVNARLRWLAQQPAMYVNRLFDGMEFFVGRSAIFLEEIDVKNG